MFDIYQNFQTTIHKEKSNKKIIYISEHENRRIIFGGTLLIRRPGENLIYSTFQIRPEIYIGFEATGQPYRRKISAPGRCLSHD